MGVQVGIVLGAVCECVVSVCGECGECGVCGECGECGVLMR